MRENRGFTLIELSIVLVIIGLIVGGILAGADLIKAAEIRATISQIEKYQTATNAFLNKYGSLPGDMSRAKSARLGFFTLSADGFNAIQNENRLLGDSSVCEGEPLIFWRHLGEAQMIDGQFGTAASGHELDAASAAPTALLSAGELKSIFPPARLGRGNYVRVYALYALGENFFHLGGSSGLGNAGWYEVNGVDAILPIEAQEMDRKMDDGLPRAGKMQAMDGALGAFEAIGSGCVDANGRYDIGGTNGSGPSCQLSLRF